MLKLKIVTIKLDSYYIICNKGIDKDGCQHFSLHLTVERSHNRKIRIKLKG